MSDALTALASEAARRRTFAIISHPHAGKTTLTEKLLLFSGAIQMAGTVKGKKGGKFATSDWMDIEKQRGISVASSVMQFDYRNHVVNLLDTPGHQDFSEDTYRVLTAVDAALMVIDAAKGVEAQTIKLLNVCRLRHTPIVTFMNKYDREVRDSLELLDEVEGCAIPAAHQSLLPLLKRIVSDLGPDKMPEPHAFDDAAWVGYRLTEILPVQALAKQKLLELDEPISRLEILHTYLAQRELVK